MHSEFFQILSAFMQLVALFCKCAFPPEIWHNILGKLHLVVFRPFRLQRNYRIMKKCLPRDSCKPLFIELEILPLPCLFIYESVIFVKNDLLNGGNIFSCNIDIYNYNTRRRNHVHQVSVSTAQYKKSTYNTCTLLYNALPDDIKQLKSVHKFKFKVKSFLLQNCFYTIRDYTDREKEK